MPEKTPPPRPFSPFDRLPPHDIEAEEAVLAACMVDEEAVPICMEMLTPADFFRGENARIFEGISSLFSRGEGINSVTVAHEIARGKQVENAVEMSTLMAMVGRLPTSVGIEFYAAIVKRDALYRAYIQALSGAMQLAYEAPAEQDAVFDRGDSLIAAARSTGSGSARVMSAGEAAYAASDDIAQFLADPRRIGGHRTGWWQLDGMINGLTPGGLYTIGAATSVGKSLFVQNVTRRFVMDDLPVLMFCTEMTASQVMRRMAFMHAGIDPYAIRQRGRSSDDERDAVNSALDVIRQWPLFLVGGKQTPASIRSMTRVHKRMHGIVMTVVDHMGQGFVNGDGDDEKQRIGDVTSTLKTVAADEDIVVLAASHVSRLHANPARLLGLADLYGSTHIEQDSSHVILLTPCELTQDHMPSALSEHKAKEQKSRHGGVAVWVDVAKNRDGGTGGVPLYLSWSGHGGRFIQMTSAHESEAAG